VTRRARVAAACTRVVESSWFDPLMLSIIAVNAVTLGLETYASIDASIGRELHLANGIILGLFVVELALRMGHNEVADLLKQARKAADSAAAAPAHSDGQPATQAG